MEQNPSSKANQFPATQEIPSIVCNPKIHYRVDKYPPLAPILNMYTFRNKASFYGEEYLAPRPTPKLEDHTMSAVCDCLFNTLVATVHIGGCSSIHNLRTRRTLVTGTHLSRPSREHTACNCQWEYPRVSLSTWNIKGLPMLFVDGSGKYKVEWQLQESNLKQNTAQNYLHFGNNRTHTVLRVQCYTKLISSVLWEI
jgi:hypothetical protein